MIVKAAAEHRLACHKAALLSLSDGGRYNAHVRSLLSVQSICNLEVAKSFLAAYQQRTVSSKLAPREQAICRRLREARDALGLSQYEVAKQLAITRERLLTYEQLRAPLRCDLALRFCRQFIISEEWLATGKNEALERIGQELLFDPGADWSAFDAIFFHQCMDLFSDPIAHSVPPRALFSAAYDEILSERYADLARDFFYTPRILLDTTKDEPEVAFNLLSSLVERWMRLLSVEANHRGADAWLVQRNYVRALVETNAFLFRNFMELKLDIAAFQKLVNKLTKPSSHGSEFSTRGSATSHIKLRRGVKTAR
ncbi:MAG: helix-turn-helix domain-containing protein [Chthoniobacterales bacterium]